MNQVSVTARAAIPYGDGKDKIFITLESSTAIDPTNPSTAAERASARATIWAEVQEDLNRQIEETAASIKAQQ